MPAAIRRCDAPCGCAARRGWPGAGSYLGSHAPGSRLPVGLAARPKRAKGAETPSPRHSFIPAVTPALAARGMPLWGPRGPPAGSGRRPGPGLSEARLAGAHGRGRRPSGAAPVPAAALPALAAAPAATPEGLGRSHAGKTYPVGGGQLVCRGPPLVSPRRVGSSPQRNHRPTRRPRRRGRSAVRVRAGASPPPAAPHLLPRRSSRAGSPRSGRPCDLRAAERPQPPKPA